MKSKALNLPPQSRYPKRLFIADTVYRVIFDKKITCYGETDSEKKTIRIKRGLSPRETMLTYLHEICHALDFEHSIRFKHKQVYKLERAIMELLLDNFL